MATQLEQITRDEFDNRLDTANVRRAQKLQQIQ